MASNLDIESPGYEFRRSYHYMNILFNKLVALNYAKEFCPEYKCRPIHKYHFSYPTQNANEQYFTFACLCAWLIKKKCQFNIRLDPQDYEEPEITIRAIVEALRLVLADVASNPANNINFAPGRLRSGYGPEVVWTLNVLADVALQVSTDYLAQSKSPPSSAGSARGGSKATKITIVYEPGGQDTLNQGDNSRDGKEKLDNRKDSVDFSNKLSILANDNDEQYDLEAKDDFEESSLLFEEDNVTLVDDYGLNHDDSNEVGPNLDQAICDDGHKKLVNSAALLKRSETSPEEWYLQVERVSHQLQANMDLDSKSLNMADWKTHFNQLKSIDQMLDRFTKNCKPFVDNSVARIDKQLQIIFSREKFLQTNLQESLRELVNTKRVHDEKLRMQSELNSKLTTRTASLEGLGKTLVTIRNQIEERVNYLNDSTPMTTIRKSIDQLKMEIAQFDIRIGLAMHALLKKRLSIKYH